MYASLLHGKSVNDCAEKNNSEGYNLLYKYAMDIAYSLTARDSGAIDLDAQKYFGRSAHINHHIQTTQIVNNKGGLSGVLIEITSSANGNTKAYTLYDCSLSSCKWK